MLEDLIDRLNSQSWWVNNLYQTNDGQWRTNLRNDSSCTAYGTGDTPSEALEAAMLEARVPIHDQTYAGPSFTYQQWREISLATQLGLTRPITRRV